MKWKGGGGSTINAGWKLMIYSRSCKTNRSIINLVKKLYQNGITEDACKVEKKYSAGGVYQRVILSWSYDKWHCVRL